MSITTYIHKLKEEKDISFRQLSIDSKISYGNIMDIKNGRIAYPTESILNKLSKYLNQSKEDILFDILKDDVDEDYSSASLRYLCYLNTHNYTIAIKPNVPNPLRTGVMVFDGYAYKKRSGNTFTVVDSWSHIKKEHWKMFKVHYNTELNRDSWTEIFINEDMYITNVLYFEIFRIETSGFENVKEVVITYDEKDHDVKYVEKFVPKKMTYKIKFVSL